MQLIVILLSVIVAILAVLNGFLAFHCLKVNKSVNTLLKNSKAKDLRNLILSHIEKASATQGQLNRVEEKIKELEKTAKITFQRVGVIRFNPFQDFGGNQSFAIAMLDGSNNGFLISSLFIKEGNRVYLKPIKNGVSEHKLSKEEEKALAKAMNI